MSTADSAIDADVTIVGFGPVGSVLAILLAQMGRSVVVLERWPAPYPLPRAVHLDHEVARIVQSCGLGEELRANSEPAHVYEWRNASGTTLLRFGRLGASASGWPESLMFHQPTLEGLLDERARALPGVAVHRGAEVAGLILDDDAVTVRTTSGEEVRAAYVVGCDGANSTVRTLAHLPVQDLGFFYDWLIVDVILDEPREFDPLNVQICDPARPTTAVSGGPGRRRWEFMRLPHESIEELADEQRAWELLASWDIHPANATLERHAVYTFNARYTEQWRAGRVLVAGDAAHLMPPFAGQGLCAGLRDAANLAWKLDLVLDGRAADALLDTYQDERLPSARSAIDFSMELGKVICVPDPAEAAARDELMAAGVTDDVAEAPALPDITSGVIHPVAPHAGALFIQGHDGDRLVDDVHGAGWRLVTMRDDPLDPELLAWFGSIGGRVLELTGSDGVYGEWFRSHDTAYALQRPDFHLYGTATTPAGAASLLGDLRHHVNSPPTPQGATP